LKIHNRSANIGLIGFFHCSEFRKKIRGSYSPANIPDLTGNHFITRRHSTGAIDEMNVDDSSEVTLPRMGFEIITVSPILGGWLAPLGRMDRYTGITSIESVLEPFPDTFEIRVRESGNYLFWCHQPAIIATNQDGPASFTYRRKMKLLNVKMKAAGSISVTRFDS